MIIPLGLCAVVDAFGILDATVIWFAIVLGHMVRAGLGIARFRQGRWRHIRVDIPPSPSGAAT